VIQIVWSLPTGRRDRFQGEPEVLFSETLRQFHDVDGMLMRVQGAGPLHMP
jgi:hypothetical protein